MLFIFLSGRRQAELLPWQPELYKSILVDYCKVINSNNLEILWCTIVAFLFGRREFHQGFN